MLPDEQDEPYAIVRHLLHCVTVCGDRVELDVETALWLAGLGPTRRNARIMTDILQHAAERYLRRSVGEAELLVR